MQTRADGAQTTNLTVSMSHALPLACNPERDNEIGNKESFKCIKYPAAHIIMLKPHALVLLPHQQGYVLAFN